jgi:hypothetical protein
MKMVLWLVPQHLQLIFVMNKQINLETTGGYASFLNGKVKRPNRTLAERARCMLINAGAPAQDWCYATEHAVDIYRATYHSAIKCAPHFV